MTAGYEAFFGLDERPFSLATDARFYFRGRSHTRVIEALHHGFQAGERFVMVTGDLGVGKTALCRTVAGQLRARSRVALIGHPLLAPEAFDRLLIEEFGLASVEAFETLTGDALIVIDEAHTLPAALVDHLLALSRRHAGSEYVFRFAFVGQGRSGDPDRLGMTEIDDRAGRKVRLLPLGRDECAAYIRHRLAVAGAAHTVQFSERAHDHVYAISGGVPRLVNLLCERALQEAAAAGTHRIEPSTLDTAASTLHLLRARPRRFRRHFRKFKT